jgi:ferredoxin
MVILSSRITAELLDMTHDLGYAPLRNHNRKERSMKVRIDPDLCTACGLCTDGVPQVFKMGKDAAEVINPAVPANLENAVRDAASDCPAEAIFIE